MTLVATSKVGVGPGVKMLDQRSSRKKPIINQVVLLSRGLIRGRGREHKQGLAGSSIGPSCENLEKGKRRERERGGFGGRKLKSVTATDKKVNNHG